MDIEGVDPITTRTWDLSTERDQNKMMSMLDTDKPVMVGLSPPCRLFSALQNLRTTPIDKAEWEQAVAMVNFCVKVAKYQMEHGRYFYFEHPLNAKSWTATELAELRELLGVHCVILHMCAFGLTSVDEMGEGLVLKPTRVLTNDEV